MVKLFVGNLADAVDAARLRTLFSEFAHVHECDVLKNFAFVHVADDEDAKRVLENLDNHMLEGRPLHIEKSTSRLRREPGMGDKCFRCGAFDHKTPNCPVDGAVSEEAKMRNARRKGETPPATVNGSKRPTNVAVTSMLDSYPPAKRGGGSPAPTTWGYMHQPPAIDPYRADVMRSGMGSAINAPASHRPIDSDPELPRPRDRDLIPLFDQYMEARQRYFYYRDRLSKELDARAQQEPFPAPLIPTQSPFSNAYTATASAQPSAHHHFAAPEVYNSPSWMSTGSTAGNPYAYGGPAPQPTATFMGFGTATTAPPRMF